jgi:serine/threonine protein kinase
MHSDANVFTPLTVHDEPPGYRAPELIAGNKDWYSNALDIWSIGCIFYYLLCRQALFKVPAQATKIMDLYVAQMFDRDWFGV